MGLFRPYRFCLLSYRRDAWLIDTQLPPVSPSSVLAGQPNNFIRYRQFLSSQSLLILIGFSSSFRENPSILASSAIFIQPQFLRQPITRYEDCYHLPTDGSSCAIAAQFRRTHHRAAPQTRFARHVIVFTSAALLTGEFVMFRLREKHCAALAGILITGLLTPICLAAAQTSLLWQTNLESAKQLAAQTNRLVLVHFWSPSCVPCKQVEKNVFSVPQVQQSIQARFVPVKINADDWPTTTKQYGIASLPTDLIITPSGQIVGRMISPQTPDAYLQKLAVESSSAAPIAAQPVAPPLNAAYSSTVPVGAAAGVGAMSPPVASGWMPAPSAVPPMNVTAGTTSAAPSAAPANVGWGAASVGKSNNSAPAISAYSDSRYAEYFQKYSPAASALAPGVNPVPGMNQAQSMAAAVPPVTGTATAYTPTSYASGGYSPPVVNTQQPVYTPPAAVMAPAAASSGYAAPAYGSPATMPPAYAPPSSSVTPVAPSISGVPSAQLAAQRLTLPAAVSPTAPPIATAADASFGIGRLLPGHAGRATTLASGRSSLGCDSSRSHLPVRRSRTAKEVPYQSGPL